MYGLLTSYILVVAGKVLFFAFSVIGSSAFAVAIDSLAMFLLTVLFSIGATVSMDKAMELFASDPSLLKLPAASQNLSDATEAQPLMVLSVEGVKVAE